MPISDPIPVEDATSLVIPGEWSHEHQVYVNGGAWQWADPILAGSSNAAEWDRMPNWHPRHGFRDQRISRSVIAQLYAAGYALVKVLPDEQFAVGDRIVHLPHHGTGTVTAVDGGMAKVRFDGAPNVEWEVNVNDLRAEQ